MSTVVVTGATGFVGTALCNELLRRKVSLIAVGGKRRPDFAGSTRNLVFSELSRLEGAKDFVCVHLAGENRIASAEEDPARARRDALELAELVGNLNFRKVVLGSSAVVYGDHSSHPHREDEEIKPNGPYAQIKAELESYFVAKPKFAIARLANVYGPGMSSSTVLSQLRRQFEDGSNEIQVRDLSPVRDFIQVTDVARGLADLVLGEATGVFNFGTGIGTSIAHLLEILKVIYELPDCSVRISAPPSDKRSALILDSEKTRRELGWRAEIPLTEGLRKRD